MYRSFQISTGDVATGLVVSGMFDNIAKFSMPVIAFVCIRLTGDTSTGLGPVAAIGVALVIGVDRASRSERCAARRSPVDSATGWVG